MTAESYLTSLSTNGQVISQPIYRHVAVCHIFVQVNMTSYTISHKYLWGHVFQVIWTTWYPYCATLWPQLHWSLCSEWSWTEKLWVCHFYSTLVTWSRFYDRVATYADVHPQQFMTISCINTQQKQKIHTNIHSQVTITQTKQIQLMYRHCPWLLFKITHQKRISHLKAK